MRDRLCHVVTHYGVSRIENIVRVRIRQHVNQTVDSHLIAHASFQRRLVLVDNFNRIFRTNVNLHMTSFPLLSHHFLWLKYVEVGDCSAWGSLVVLSYFNFRAPYSYFCGKERFASPPDYPTECPVSGQTGLENAKCYVRQTALLSDRAQLYKCITIDRCCIFHAAVRRSAEKYIR